MAVTIKQSTEKPTVETIDGIERWKVEDAASTLQRVMEIKQDAKLWKTALKVLKEKEKATQKAVDWAENLGR